MDIRVCEYNRCDTKERRPPVLRYGFELCSLDDKVITLEDYLLDKNPEAISLIDSFMGAIKPYGSVWLAAKTIGVSYQDCYIPLNEIDKNTIISCKSAPIRVRIQAKSLADFDKITEKISELRKYRTGAPFEYSKLLNIYGKPYDPPKTVTDPTISGPRLPRHKSNTTAPGTSSPSDVNGGNDESTVPGSS